MALAYISGISSPLVLDVSTLIFAVLVIGSRIGFINDIVPENVFPGSDCIVNSSLSPFLRKGRSDS